MIKITNKISNNSIDKSNESREIFKNLNVYILPNGMGKSRVELFRTSLQKQGANLIEENKVIIFKNFESNIDTKFYIIFDENIIKNLDNIEKSLAKKKFYISIKNFAESNSNLKIFYVSSLWLSECLKQKCLIETKPYELIRETCLKENITPEQSTQSIDVKSSKRKCENLIDENDLIKLKKSNIQLSYSNSSCSESDYDDDFNFENELKAKSKQILDNKSWTCAHSSKEQDINYNKHITDKLEQISSIYENTKDKYRALGYQKAILILKKHPKQIETRQEALNLPGVGKRIADKIWEILQTGDLRKLDELNSREDINSIKMFTEVHGIGPTTAQNFVAQGMRTLDDLRTKANLTRQQKIGLKYYEEFKQRIPRDEVAKIEKIVKEAALTINNGLIVQACGSYRRGKATCGDVDILVTHPDGHSHKNIFNKLLNLLHEMNFLTDDLVLQDESSDSHKKYLGVCQLNENSLHRRLDIIVVPYDEYACALIYFTGSAHFNRSMRHLAKKLGLSLSEKSLNKNVIRKGSEKTYTGEKMTTSTEEDVFKLLNIPYRKPEERDF